MAGKEFEVKRLVDRREYVDGDRDYRVVWAGYPVMTWEPAQQLAEDGLQWMMDAVDRWLDSESTDPFVQWAASDSTMRSRQLGANSDNDCGFQAVRKAFELLGWPNLFSEKLKNEFRKGQLMHGVKWKHISAFLKSTMEKATADVRIVTSQSLLTRVSGVQCLRKLKLVNGVYVCGAYPRRGTGHCFVLSVREDVKVIYDEGREERLEVYGEWIKDWSFVRKLEIS